MNILKIEKAVNLYNRYSDIVFNFNNYHLGYQVMIRLFLEFWFCIGFCSLFMTPDLLDLFAMLVRPSFCPSVIVSLKNYLRDFLNFAGILIKKDSEMIMDECLECQKTRVFYFFFKTAQIMLSRFLHDWI